MIEYDIAYSQGGVRRIRTYCFRVLRYKSHQDEGVVHDKCRGTLKRYNAEEAAQYTVGAVTFYPKEGLGRTQAEDYARDGEAVLAEVIDNIPLLKQILTYGHRPDTGDFFVRAMAGSHVKVDHTIWALMTVRNIVQISGVLPTYQVYRRNGYTVMAAFMLSLLYVRMSAGPFRRKSAIYAREWGDYNTFNPYTMGRNSYVQFIKQDMDSNPWLLGTWDVDGRYTTDAFIQGRVGLHGYAGEDVKSLLNALVLPDDVEFEPMNIISTGEEVNIPEGQVFPHDLQQGFIEIFEEAGKPFMEQ